jgi:hypothetical protein
MLRRMGRRPAVAALLAALSALALCAPALAAGPSPAATPDLIPGPPGGSWTASTDDTGPITADDFYGTPNASAPGFVDAFGKGWYATDLGVSDALLHYSSVFWADYALDSFKSGAQDDPDRTSFGSVAGFGSNSFEVTYPADSQGYKSDWIFFAQGDYMAALVVWDNALTDRYLLIDQATRQLDMLPIPTAEYQAIGYGVLGGLLVVVLIIALMIGSGIVIAVVVLRRRQPSMSPMYAVPYGPPVGPQLSDDRRYWWDGSSWQDTATRIPPGSQISPDGTRWWDGAVWRDLPTAGRLPT